MTKIFNEHDEYQTIYLNLPPSTLMSWNGLVTLAHYGLVCDQAHRKRLVTGTLPSIMTRA
jgi:hypothetical protein